MTQPHFLVRFKSAVIIPTVFFCAFYGWFSPVIAQPTTLFELLSPKSTGIKFRNDINETENLNVLAYEYFYNGGGVAVGDINNDGLPDLYFSANMQPNKLYLNQGKMVFKDITSTAGKGLEGRKGSWKTGVTMADINGDGLLDIYVCYSGKLETEQRRNQLFINKGNTNFEEQAATYGLDDPGFSTQAVFFDFDNDDDLDMYLLNHSTKKIDNLELAKYRSQTDEFAGSKLFENKGNHFEDISKKAGIHQNPLTFGLGIAIADVNKDGWQDIYVTNDYNEPDYLYINNKNSTFSDATPQSLNHLSQFSMGVDIADFNNDALPDILTLDMLPEDNGRQKQLQLQENYESFELQQQQGLHKQYMRNMLHLNNGDGSFSEIGQLAGIAATDWSWCPLFADFDNDGYKDIFISTGYLRDYTNKDFLRYWGDYKVKKAIDREPVLLMDLIKAMPVTLLPNYVFSNNKDLSFTNQQINWGFTTPVLSNGAIYADLDNDGDLDMVINNINETAFVYKNNSIEKGAGNFINLQLNYKKGNPFAIGSKVYLYSNNTVQYQEVNPNRGYLSCVSTLAHFGVGKGVSIDSVRIVWPDQKTELITNITANQFLKVDYKQQLTVQNITNANPAPLFRQEEPLIEYRHETFADNDFKRQLLMLFMYSQTGPITTVADINKDGLEDFYISGDKNKNGAVYIQQPNGKFDAIKGLAIGDENVSAAAAASFFDANGDGWPDLYVAKGGYSLFEPSTASLQDELFINNGKGNLVLSQGLLPDLSANSKSCIRPCDFDGDGDLDLFIGGRVIPGKYPMAPQSYLLVNNGKGKFERIATAFDSIGMVTDALWTDLNKDGKQDLIITGEMMPIKVFLNHKDGFEDKTIEYFGYEQNGFWNTITLADVNNDGQADLIAGNLGLNTAINASVAKPAELFFTDVDGNGSIDPFFNFYLGDTSYPFVSRDELNEQIYPMRKKFTSYKNYSTARISDIVPADILKQAGKLTATQLKTTCFINQQGKFVETTLPIQAQFSLVNKIVAEDFNADGHTDLLLLGNHTDNRLKLGSFDANYGCLLLGDGKGGFSYVKQTSSGLQLRGDVKSANIIKAGNHQYLMMGITGKGLEYYRWK